jgi:ADP-ribose pyrophosphatase YjhB (NUDIX family)
MQKRPQLRRFNRYQDVEIDASLLPHDEIGKFLNLLSAEESKWISGIGHGSARSRALFWVKVGVRLCHLLPPLIGTGTFAVHHATPEYIMLVKGPGTFTNMENVPLYGTHYTRVECIVLENNNNNNRAPPGDVGATDRTLVVREMIGNTECCRKLVTGSVEPGEYISRAAEREVLEETGVTSRFVGAIGVVNRICTRFGRDEILVGCVLVADPPGQTPRASSSEIRDAEWIGMDELSNSSGNCMAKKWCDAYRAMMMMMMAGGGAGPVMTERSATDFRGHGHTMMMYSM